MTTIVMIHLLIFYGLVFKENCSAYWISMYVPSKMLSSNSRQPWINRYIKQLSRRKHRCYNRAKMGNSPSEWAYYKFLKKEMQNKCRKARNSYLDKTLFNPFMSSKKKNFFRYIKSMRRDNYGIPTLQKDGITYSSDVDKAEVLNRHFASVFTKDSGLIVPNLDPSPYPELLPFEVTVDEVNTLLGEVEPFKATGPDGIPPKLLKELAYVLAPSLALLFNASLK